MSKVDQGSENAPEGRVIGISARDFGERCFSPTLRTFLAPWVFFFSCEGMISPVLFSCFAPPGENQQVRQTQNVACCRLASAFYA